MLLYEFSTRPTFENLEASISYIFYRHHDEDQEIVVDNADEHVDDEVDLDEEATTISANKHLVYSDTAGSDETTTIENLEEEEIETTTVVVGN